MGTDAFIAGFAVGLENKLKQEARERGEPLDVVTPTYQDKKPGETITAREAAKDLNRTEVAPTEAADYEARLQRRWAIHRANDACSTDE